MMIDFYIPTRTVCKNGIELDAIEDRRFLNWGPGEVSAIKRGMRRRARRQARQIIRAEFLG